MEPTVNVGDLVFVIETNEINKDDIISFKENNSIVTHRVIDILEDENGEKQYKTKGDANQSEDVETVKLQDIEGKFIFKIGQVGNIILFLKSEVGIILFVLILAVILFFSYSKNNDENESKEKTKEKDKEEYKENEREKEENREKENKERVEEKVKKIKERKKRLKSRKTK